MFVAVDPLRTVNSSDLFRLCAGVSTLLFFISVIVWFPSSSDFRTIYSSISIPLVVTSPTGKGTGTSRPFLAKAIAIRFTSVQES